MFKELENRKEFEELISDGLVIVDFFTTWCGPCKMLSPELHELGEERNDVKVIKVDCDKFVDLSSQYQIEAVPTIYYLKNGKAIKKTLGYMDKEAIERIIDSL